ncbi:S9 family peptidase [Haloarcula pelagica]|uniref:S9 family peptidase n=1 Tax=Haloarcula pelagica TaxID=3033389 RepID=UPI0024C3DBEE|nr:prolyl oligopeptidase family serine peptidase [Halomicroarcula sp. YJ-61-S]
MTTTDTTTANRSTEQFEAYLDQLARSHGVSGYTMTPEGTLVYAAYDGGEYDLQTPNGSLTDADGDLTNPTWLRDRGTLLAYRDQGGTEQYDLLEVDPESGSTTPVLNDGFRNFRARQHPTVSDQVSFVSNRNRSLDLYTVTLDDGTVTRLSESDAPVMGYAWSPDGTRIVYQAGTVDDACLRVVDRRTGRDDVFVDEPDSEQSFAFTDDGRGAWGTDGVVFTTNHQTGYRELAVAEPDGDYTLRYVNNRDKYDPQWTEGGDIVFLEASRGDWKLRRLTDGAVTTVESSGMNVDVKTIDGDVYYRHSNSATDGDLHRDGDPVVTVGQVDGPTVSPEDVTYESFDGTEIAARLYMPDCAPVGGIVKAHGGPEAQAYNPLDLTTQALAHAGFEVLAPDVRGSLGYGRAFRTASDEDLGGDDLTDVVAAASYLRERGRENVGIVGTAYGGSMALLGVGATDAFDASASVCGVVDWETAVENTRGDTADMLLRKFCGAPAEKPDLYADRSPITYVDDIDVPVLIVQGGNDPRVPQSEVDRLIASLQERDVEHEYLLFDDEGHGVERTANRVEYNTRTVEFFGSTLCEN